MLCRDVREKLTALAAGELPADLRRGVLAHCAGCPPCRRALENIDLLAAVLIRLEDPPVPPGFLSRLLEAAREKPDEVRRPLAWWRSASPALRAAAALFLIAGLAGGIALGRPPAPPAGRTDAGSRSDPIETYQLDYLGEAPAGSLADSYQSLLATADGGGR